MGISLLKKYKYHAFVAGFILILIATAVAFMSGSDAALEIKSIAASKTTFGEAQALHQPGSDGFWETHGPFPVSLVIELKQPAMIAAYQLRSDSHMPEAGERMPAAWKVFLSNDGRDWREVDNRKDAKLWSAAELREYPLKEKSKAQFVKIEIINTSADDLLRIARLSLR